MIPVRLCSDRTAVAEAGTELDSDGCSPRQELEGDTFQTDRRHPEISVITNHGIIQIQQCLFKDAVLHLSNSNYNNM